MQTFVFLAKHTDEGARAIHDAAASIELGNKAFESLGGKIVGFWVLTGEYRYLLIGEATPEVAMEFLALIESRGIARLTMYPAFSKQEFARAIEREVAAAVV